MRPIRRQCDMVAIRCGKPLHRVNSFRSEFALHPSPAPGPSIEVYAHLMGKSLIDHSGACFVFRATHMIDSLRSCQESERTWAREVLGGERIAQSRILSIADWSLTEWPSKNRQLAIGNVGRCSLTISRPFSKLESLAKNLNQQGGKEHGQSRWSNPYAKAFCRL